MIARVSSGFCNVLCAYGAVTCDAACVGWAYVIDANLASLLTPSKVSDGTNKLESR